MNNAEMAAVFREIAALLRERKENIFKIRSYEKVARSIEEMDEDVAKLAAEGRLRELPGAGDAITKKITELVNTGKLEYLERLRAEAEIER